MAVVHAPFRDGYACHITTFSGELGTASGPRSPLSPTRSDLTLSKSAWKITIRLCQPVLLTAVDLRGAYPGQRVEYRNHLPPGSRDPPRLR